MALRKIDLDFFPEEYLLAEDEMGESNSQFQLIRYLVGVLEWLFRVEKWYIAGNLELYHPEIRNSQGKITPDISVFKDIEISAQERQSLTSWDISPGRAAPPVVFEISSRSTWHSDIWAGEQRKPAIFGRMGVKEYFAYDPHEPPVWSGTNDRRLLGWRYQNGEPVEILADEQGRLWSEELNSWLKADGNYLRLYDRENHLRLTESEAKEIVIQTNQQRIAELERQLRELKGANSQD
jgi:Uma2 family endonuclease